MSISKEVRFEWVKDWQKEVPTDKLDEYAQRVLEDARRYCPVDTGALRDSIEYELDTSGEEIGTFRIGSNLHYAVYQELGTSFIDGQFFLKRALQNNSM